MFVIPRYELTSGIGGLKDMDSSKDIVHLFISEYGTLFAEEGDLCPKDFWVICQFSFTNLFVIIVILSSYCMSEILCVVCLFIIALA